MQVDISDAVERELVAFGAVLVDVSGGQTRQLLYSFVIAGDRREFNGHEYDVPTVDVQNRKAKKRNQQSERVDVHGGKGMDKN